MIKPVALVNGHYECASSEQSVPILEELLSLEVVSRDREQLIMKHPNTEWLIILHENAGAYKQTSAIITTAFGSPPTRRSTTPTSPCKNEKTNSVSRLFRRRPGGIRALRALCRTGRNYWEIESYEGGAKKNGLSNEVASVAQRAFG